MNWAISRLSTVISGSPGGVTTMFCWIAPSSRTFHFQENWISYRATAEALRHEILLYKARAGEYATYPAPEKRLAELAIAIVKVENARWVSVQETAKPQALPPGGDGEHAGAIAVARSMRATTPGGGSPGLGGDR